MMSDKTHPTAYNALYNYQKYSGVKGMFCAHKHCHGHVPFGMPGHQAAQKANLCVKCYKHKRHTSGLKEFPLRAIAEEDTPCCTTCVGFCKCRSPWDFVKNRYTCHDIEQGCGDVLKLANSEEAHTCIAKFKEK